MFRLRLKARKDSKSVKEEREMNKLFKNRSGQNTVEYLLMLAVIVGVVLLTGAAIKKFMPGLFESISKMISDASGQLASDK